MMTDNIADMLTRIRNAQLARKAEVEIPFSKVKLEIAKVLERMGVVERVIEHRSEKKSGKHGMGSFVIKLRYVADHPVLRSLKRVSRPGLRVYVGKDELENVQFGYGFSILSTSQGIMTNSEAKKKGLGGEVLCEIY